MSSMMVLGLDLGQNLAAVYARTWTPIELVDDRRRSTRDVICCRTPDVACWEKWPEKGDSWTLDEAARFVGWFLGRVWDGETPIVCEQTWFRKIKGRPITPGSITPIAAMIGAVCTIAPRRVLLVEPALVSQETGISKDVRAEEMPRYMLGLNLEQFRGPKGGSEPMEHPADAAFLAYYGATRGVVRSD